MAETQQIIKGLLPSGKTPSTQKAEIIELIKAEAPAPDLTSYATKEEVAQASAVKHLTLTSPVTALSTQDWDTTTAQVLVVSQDGAGGRKATYAGEDIILDEAPRAATITAWVFDGTAWVWRSSAGAAAVEPPAWAPGATVKTGTVSATEATFIFSERIPAGASVQYRAGASDTWRATVSVSPTTVAVKGLAPESTYGAFDFRLVNAAGPSGHITAEPFSTPVKPPGWEKVALATFTSDSEIPLAQYVPELGGPLKQLRENAQMVVAGGKIMAKYTGVNFASPPLTWGTMPVVGKKMRLSMEYSGGNRASQGFLVRTNTPALSFTVTFGQGLITANPSLGQGSMVETTGKVTSPPASGFAVLEAFDDVFTLTIDGQLYRRWEVTWGTQFGTPPDRYPSAVFYVSGSDLHSGQTVSTTQASEISVELWQ